MFFLTALPVSVTLAYSD